MEIFGHPVNRGTVFVLLGLRNRLAVFGGGVHLLFPGSGHFRRRGCQEHQLQHHYLHRQRNDDWKRGI